MDVRELIDRVLETVDGNQAELARRLGRSETTISRWANGRNGLDCESALRIARMTGIPPRQVFTSAGLDPDLFPILVSAQSGSEPDPAEAEWNGFYHRMPPERRSTVIPMVRAAANTSAEGTANASGGPINSRKRSARPGLIISSTRGGSFDCGPRLDLPAASPSRRAYRRYRLTEPT